MRDCCSRERIRRSVRQRRNVVTSPTRPGCGRNRARRNLIVASSGRAPPVPRCFSSFWKASVSRSVCHCFSISCASHGSLSTPAGLNMVELRPPPVGVDLNPSPVSHAGRVESAVCQACNSDGIRIPITINATSSVWICGCRVWMDELFCFLRGG